MKHNKDGSPVEPTDPTIAPGHEYPSVTAFYGNARSFRQASGEFCSQILQCDATVWAITESHLKDDPTKQLIPRGYKVVA